MLKRVYLISLFAFLVLPIFSQSNLNLKRNDELNTINDSLNKIYSYLVDIGDIEYLNGMQYLNIRNKYNHPFFGENKWSTGKISYKGITYQVERIKYDINEDKVILLIENKYGTFIISLINNFIDEFYISDNHFIRYNYLPDYKNYSGYFECLYNKKTKLLVKHYIIEDYSNNESKKTFNKTKKGFIEKNGVYYKLNGKRSILKALEDQKLSVKKYMSTNSYVFSKYNLKSIINILDFYNEYN